MFALIKVRWARKEVEVLMVGNELDVHNEWDRLVRRNNARNYSVQYNLIVRKVG